jgi:selenocysteine-specific elongation factor
VRLLAGGRHVAEEAFYQAIWSEAADRLRTQHEAKPHLASAGREALWSWLKGRGLPPSVWLESFASEGLLTLEGGRVRLGGWNPRRTDVVEAAMRALDTALREGRFSPPSLPPAGAGLPHEVVSAALETLLEEGQVVCPSGLAGGLAGEPVFHRQAVDTARRRLEEHLDLHGEVTVAEFRDMLDSTRKFVLPLLEYFDREKVTFRRGDLRVRHPSRRDGDGGGQLE